MDGWSIEATLPKKSEVENLAELVPAGTEVFLSTLPHVSLDQQIETAHIVRVNGFEPVLHVAARYFASRTELVGYLARANRETHADNMLIIGGDAERPKGEFGSALSLIESGLLADYGIHRIGIAGYPDGHPKISDERLDHVLDEKIEAAREAGMQAHIVTQFCFNAGPITAWLSEVRGRWPEIDIKIGLAGPTGLKTLLKFAMRCGVKAPLNGIGQKLTLASQLAKSFSPGALIDELNAKLIDANLIDTNDARHLSIHFFSFGGLEKTAGWVAERLAEYTETSATA